MMSKRKCEWRTLTNEEQQQNEDIKMKWQLTSQKPPGGSPKQVPSLGVLDFWLQTLNKLLPQKKYISKHKCKNYMSLCKCLDNKWCFNDKNVFNTVRVV